MNNAIITIHSQSSPPNNDQSSPFVNITTGGIADATAQTFTPVIHPMGSTSLSRRADRVSTLRFDFELGEASHLDSVLATIKRIDSVYEAYRVVPGRGG